ncbi:MAG: hypothetical protein ABIW38_12735 [Ferruginibacter sp.]
MKKLVAMIVGVVMLSAFVVTEASAQNSSFWYYPNSNVYYDLSGKQYVFYNAGNWSSSKTLPSGITLEKGSPRVTVYHAGKDVWVDNAGHVMKYKNYKGNSEKKGKEKFKQKVKED